MPTRAAGCDSGSIVYCLVEGANSRSSTHSKICLSLVRSQLEGWLSEERRLIDLDIWAPPDARSPEPSAEETEPAVLFGAYAK